jgi:GTP-binding protein
LIRIVESKYCVSAVKTSDYPVSIINEFAFVGRSNVGKSSMINSLTGRKLLAKTANQPGKTKLINFFECRYIFETNDNNESSVETLTKFMFVDLPGYGFAKVSQKEKDSWKKMIKEYFSLRQQLTGAIVLVDIRHDADSKDIMMIKLLQDLEVNFMVVATKCDKISKNKIISRLKILKEGLFLKTNLICEFSSLEKIGLNKVLSWIETNLNYNKSTIIH